MNILKWFWNDFSKSVIHDNRGIFPAALAFLANPAFWQGASAVASAAGPIASQFLGKKQKGGETVNLEQLLPSWQRESLQGLSGWANQYLKNFVPGTSYTGKFTAEPTTYEKLGLGQLGSWLKEPATGELYGGAKEQLLSTLAGTYTDVGESPWIKAMTQLSKMNLEDVISQARRGAGARGEFFTTGALGEEERLRERTLANLDALIGQFVESERGRQFQAIPIAQQLEKYGMLEAPLAKIGATQTYGALERTIEQADLESQYQDFIRQRKEMTIPLDVAQGLAGGTPFPSQLQMPTREEPSSLSNILNIINRLNLKSIGKPGSTIWDIFKTT